MKGTQGVIQIENPNLAKPKNLKARDVDVSYLRKLLLGCTQESYLFYFGYYYFPITPKLVLLCSCAVRENNRAFKA